jgi:hypothetical protein
MAEGQGGRRLAKGLALIAGLGVAIVPLAETIAWALIARATMLPPDAVRTDAASGMVLEAANAWGISFSEPSQITPAALAAGWVIALVGAVPPMIGLWSVRRTFLENAQGRPFSEASVRGFRRFAWASLIAMVVAIVERSATGVAVSVLSPDIQNVLSIGFGSEDVSRLFGALLLVAVAHMFAEGRRLAEDVEGLL